METNTVMMPRELTAENGAKAALIGEFSIEFPMNCCCDGEDEDCEVCGGTGETAVTREMIGAAHDIMLKRGDFVLSAALLEKIYLAMEAAAPPPQTPFDTCPTCEALARAVMMDQTGAA